MPCPYFEPRQAAANPQHPGARLPLIEEFDGTCHADAEPVPVPETHRFACCNHGYPAGTCEHFPPQEKRSCFRYSVVRRTPAALELMCVEEQEYAPLRWHPVRYFFAGERLEPEIRDAPMQAQILAFCRSYLNRFSH